MYLLEQRCQLGEVSRLVGNMNETVVVKVWSRTDARNTRIRVRPICLVATSSIAGFAFVGSALVV